MLIAIFALGLLIAIVIALLFSKTDSEVGTGIGIVFSVGFAFALMMSLMFLGNRDQSQFIAKRPVLVAAFQRVACVNHATKDWPAVISAVHKWNQKLAQHQEAAVSVWTSVYWPDSIRTLKPIPYTCNLGGN